jgi:hypothetical protein
VASGSVFIDKAPPSVGTPTASPNPTIGAFTLSAPATDPAPSSGISGGEWFEGADPGNGNGNAMTAGSGAITASLNAGSLGWAAGAHTLNVRARDAAGNWSPTRTVVVTSDLLFADSFGTGNFSRWSGGRTGGNRAQVVAGASLAGTPAFGLQAQVNNTAYVTDLTPAAAASYRARFRFDPNGALPTGTPTIFTASTATFSTGGNAVVQVQFRRVTTPAIGYEVRAGVRRQVGNTLFTPWVPIPAGASWIEVAWQSANSAAFTLIVNGSVQTLTGVDTSFAGNLVQSARLGPSTGLGGTGTVFLDDFVSTRTMAIGP